jgi:hypothetical protein
MRTTILTICALVCLAASATAQITLDVDASPKRVAVNEPIRATMLITGPDAAASTAPTLEQTNDFSIRSIGFASQIGTNTEPSKSYTFIYTPQRTGTFKVGAASVSYNGKTVKSPGVTVTVTPSTAPSQGPGQNTTSDQRGQTAPGTSSRKGTRDIFVETSVDKKNPYVGEQVTLTFEVFQRPSLMDSRYEPPALTGFWEVSLPKIPPSKMLIDNTVYQYNAVKTALFPTNSGDLIIGQTAFSFTVSSFFSRTRPSRLTTDPITLKARPLPKQDRPDDFGGAVGRFTITAATDRTTAGAGEAVTLRVAVSGIGNLDLVTDFTTPDLEAFRVYDPTVSETISNSGNTVGGTKMWEYILVPTSQGTAAIGEFSLSFFDPAEERYFTVRTLPVALEVTAGAATSYSGDGGDDSGRQRIQNLANDIRYLKPDTGHLSDTHRRLYGTGWYALFFVLPIAGFAAVFTVKRRRDTLERNTGLRRRLNAGKRMQKALEQAKRHIGEGDVRAFCGILHDAIMGFICDSLNIVEGSMTISALEDTLRDHGVSEDLTNRTTRALSLCDFVQFSSTGSGSEVREKMLEETRTILRELKEVL